MLVVAQGDTVTCIFDDNNLGVFGPFATVGPVANQTYETIPLVADATLNAGDISQVQCADYTANDSTSFYNGAMTATLVNKATGSSVKFNAAHRPHLPTLPH
jgi:hypothetical protein